MKPKIYTVTDHDIDPSSLDSDALWIVQNLRKAQFHTYIVGGCVRDLLFKKTPKDIDISTEATPEEIKQIFGRRCLLIGRRFRLAHIRFNKKIIEVSTFRAGENTDSLIVRDNEWGSAEEDVKRRDFTINGLFYDPYDHTIIDYIGGWEDIHKKVLKTIGSPSVRFKQDPVRMIRLLKFQARYGLSIDPKTLDALRKCKQEILKSSPARLLEEILRILESGSATAFFKAITKEEILNLIFPSLDRFLKGPYQQQVFSFLQKADHIQQLKGRAYLKRSVLISCLLYPILALEIQKKYLDKEKIPHLGEITKLASEIIKTYVISSFIHFPRRLAAEVIHILTTQYRLTPLTKKYKMKQSLLKSIEFQQSLTFLKLRSLDDPSLLEHYNYWSYLYKKQHKPSNKKPFNKKKNFRKRVYGKRNNTH